MCMYRPAYRPTDLPTYLPTYQRIYLMYLIYHNQRILGKR